MRAGPAIQAPRESIASRPRLVAPFFALLVPGTGGAYAPEGLANLDRWAYQSAIEIQYPRRQDATDARTTTDRVRQIRDAFGLNMSELATMLDVSRPTVYAWLNGQEPQAEAVARILRLSRAADRFSAMDAGTAVAYVRQPLFEGASLLELLKSDMDTSQPMARISDLAKRSKAVRHAPKASGKRLRPIEQVDDLSTPATHEPD